MKLDLDEYQRIFNKTKNAYPETRDLDIRLKFKKNMFFTMRSAVNPGSIFSKERKYLLLINSRRKELFLKLDEHDLTAWFAHELAHIIEYKKMSNGELLVFIIRYAFNPKFRFAVEKRVNAYAANNGFAFEMFAIWKKFLSLEEVVNSKYKRYIIKNYRPDWEQIRDSALKNGVSKEMYDAYEY